MTLFPQVLINVRNRARFDFGANRGVKAAVAQATTRLAATAACCCALGHRAGDSRDGRRQVAPASDGIRRQHCRGSAQSRALTRDFFAPQRCFRALQRLARRCSWNAKILLESRRSGAAPNLIYVDPDTDTGKIQPFKRLEFDARQAGCWELEVQRQFGCQRTAAQSITQRRVRACRMSNAPCALPFPICIKCGRLWRDRRLRWGAQDVSQFERRRVYGRGVGGHAAGFRLPLRDRRPFGTPQHLRRERCGSRGASLSRRCTKRLTPIVCVGETLQERESGRHGASGRRAARCRDRGGGRGGIWARRSSLTSRSGRSARASTATPEQAQAVHAFIRARIAAHDAAIAAKLRDSVRRQRQGGERGPVVRNARHRRRTDRRRVAGSGRIHGDLQAAAARRQSA